MHGVTFILSLSFQPIPHLCQWLLPSSPRALEATVSLEGGLQRTIEWTKENLVRIWKRIQSAQLIYTKGLSQLQGFFSLRELLFLH